MRVPLLDLPKQYQTIKEEVEPGLLGLLEKQQCVLGEPVKSLEDNMARYCQCNYAIGVSSGTDALLCSLMALDIGSTMNPSQMNSGVQDEVIVPTFTFFATAGSVVRTGARPVFVDIDKDTFNIDIDKIEAAITEHTKAILPVHLYGQMAPMKEIMVIARKNNLKVIEDACQAIGARQNNNGPGHLSDTACLSFYPTKNLSAFGDAGMILCQDEHIAQKCHQLRVHGGLDRYHHQNIGANFRLDAIQALVVDIKLKYLDIWQKRRLSHAHRYDELLCSDVKIPRITQGNRCVYHQYVIRAPQRDTLKSYLEEKGISTAIFYPLPLHVQECFAYLGGKRGDCPVAEQLCQEVLALPVVPELTQEQIDYVAGCINDFYGHK
ncbi:MAG: DegT/DnrJ/EryC1/StrS family aminotransferase [Sedimentisphaerales bacterium]|nr:DegT/DnrJ/EryC1/StrS family aminotransferase [Sedimentisphaerales bacterium]